ncbi:hypothetical protein CFC21_035019 [Triticum aestivum]|uniref:Uncharacterized protein n=3 Tax=Triticum TaxID=4564 RepID=A0A9R0VI32_TRITD|nr:hypothetical protein CFC21_035019 [Triticum aestivum]VAH59860.1 unnamed protein product [Triticum turgidum subsp. durum]
MASSARVEARKEWKTFGPKMEGMTPWPLNEASPPWILASAPLIRPPILGSILPRPPHASFVPGDSCYTRSTSSVAAGNEEHAAPRHRPQCQVPCRRHPKPRCRFSSDTSRPVPHHCFLSVPLAHPLIAGDPRLAAAALRYLLHAGLGFLIALQQRPERQVPLHRPRGPSLNSPPDLLPLGAHDELRPVSPRLAARYLLYIASAHLTSSSRCSPISACEEDPSAKSRSAR